MSGGYRGLKSDLDVLQTVYTPFAGQGHDSEEEDSENDEAPPQRFAGGGGGGEHPAPGVPRSGSAIQVSLQFSNFCLV